MKELTLLSYLFSWIANLGVVPLFLSSAFLLAPIFLRLFFLIVLVFFVKEPIFTFLTAITERRLYLPSSLRFVKSLGLFSLLITRVVISNSYAQNDQYQSHILAKGEQKTLKFADLEKYSVGNKEVLRSKYQGEQLLLKGISVGFSDLVVWQKNKQQHYKIYVLSKRSHLKTLKLAEVFSNMGLKWQLKGDLIHVSGKIENIHQWQLLHKMYHKNHEKLFFQIKLSRKLRNQAIADIYQDFYQAGVEVISCKASDIELSCQSTGDQKKLTPLIEKWKKKLPINFNIKPFDQISRNYRVKLHILKIESSSDHNYRMGLSKLETTIEELIDRGERALVENNHLLVGEEEFQLKTVATPELLLSLNQKSEIEIGSEIPITRRTSIFQQEGPVVQWKFIGLKLDLTLHKTDQNFKTNYQLSFSRPLENGVQTSKEISQVYLKNQKTQKLFDIKFKSEGHHNSGVPIISEIPLLGNLFQGHSENHRHQKLLGFITLKEIKDAQ